MAVRNITGYVRDPGPKRPATGLKAAVTTDNAIVTETMMEVLLGGSASLVRRSI
jgi:gamma-glutamyltranspeptidase/glutathione hydrolase